MQTSAHDFLELLQDPPVDYFMKLVERMPTVCKAKGGDFEKNLNYELYSGLFNTFMLTT